MSDGEIFRPRRAWQPADDEVDLPDLDDTAAEPQGPARRGSADEYPEDLFDDDSAEVDADADAPESALDAQDVTAGETASEVLNPFARPGSEAADAPLPADVYPTSDTFIPAPVFPRSAGEYADSPSPAPRRSALSSTTPVEPEPVPEATASGDWVSAHRRTLTTWAVAGVALAVIVGLLSFFVSRGTRPAVEPSSSPSASPSASPSTSPSASAPTIEADALLLPHDLDGIAPAASWAITETTTSVADHSGRGACLSTEDVEVNAVTSLQRLLATSDADQLAALHRIDVYASEEAAVEVFNSRATALAGCAEVPALIVRSSAITGLADDARQLTIAFENAPTQYHTVLLTRVGSAVQLVDFARNETPVDATAMSGVLTRTQTDLCAVEGGACPTDVTVVDAPVPAADPVGWLIPADLPRIRPGAGRWTAQDPSDTITARMGCENMEIATEPGPSTRQQSTYLMTQDEQRPDTFGMDEVMFTFADATAAAEFTWRLGQNLATCKDRVLTAAVTEHTAVAAVGKDGLPVSSRLFTITQATSDTEALTYQLIVSAAGTQVTYTLITVTDAYKFSPEQLNHLAARIPVRASQLL